jgi:hypothetical protein
MRNPNEEAISIYLTKDTMSKVREHKSKTNIPHRWIIEMALEDYFKKGLDKKYKV